MGQSKGSRMADNGGRSKRSCKCKCHKCGKFGVGMHSREASAFEASKTGLAETMYVDMVSSDPDAQEIRAVLLFQRNRQIQNGIDSRAAVIGHVSEELQVLFGFECSKGEREASRCVIVVRESENGRDVQSLGGSVRERHEPRCVLPLLRRRYRSVCIPRGMWNGTGARVK